MDTITQAVLGAAVGQAAVGHKLGRRALGWGAVGGLLPDLDSLASVALGPWGELEWHRGPTHALWFGPIVGTLLGWLAWRLAQRRHERALEHARPGKPPPDPGRLRDWVILWVLALFTHPLLDMFTTYGTQLLSPFDNTRFAFNGVGIIDPVYTLALALALILARWLPRYKRALATAALALTTGYVLWGVRLNHQAEQLARAQLAEAGVEVTSVRAYPTIFQLFLRRVVARSNDQSAQVGYVSMWRPQPIAFKEAAPSRHPLLEQVQQTPGARLFQWFALGQTLTVVEVGPEGGLPAGEVRVSIEDIRYGYPGTPGRGLWGISQRFGPDGQPLGPLAFNRRGPPENAGEIFRNLWRDAFP